MNRSLMRRRLLAELYDKMSDEEKRTFVLMTLQDSDHREIMQRLEEQRAHLQRIEKKQNWKTDFLSDVGANFLTDGLIFLGRLLFK